MGLVYLFIFKYYARQNKKNTQKRSSVIVIGVMIFSAPDNAVFAIMGKRNLA